MSLIPGAPKGLVIDQMGGSEIVVPSVLFGEDRGAQILANPIPGGPAGLSFDQLGGSEMVIPSILFEDIDGIAIIFDPGLRYSRNAMDLLMPWRRPTILPDGELGVNDRASNVGYYNVH